MTSCLNPGPARRFPAVALFIFSIALTLPATAYELWNGLTFTGKVSSSVGSDVAMVVAPDGTIYYADADHHVIGKVVNDVPQIIAGQYNVSGQADGVGSAATFNTPSGITIDSAGNLYVADAVSSRIRKITPSGAVTTIAGHYCDNVDGNGTQAGFCTPKGITIDPSGNLYVADSSNNKIRKITPAGVVTTFAGCCFGAHTDGTGTSARFNSPVDVYYRSGFLYVADYFNHSIRKIDVSNASVSTVAGWTISQEQDGSGATFGKVTGVTATPDGTLFVADPDLSAVRRIGSDGWVTTAGGVFRWVGLRDGTGSHALFTAPKRVAVVANEDIWLNDSGKLFHGTRRIDDAAQIDSATGQTTVARNLSVSPFTSSSWTWSVAGPPNSTATVASPNAASTTFTPDIGGYYTIRLDAGSASGTSITYTNLQAYCSFPAPTLHLDSPNICPGGTDHASVDPVAVQYMWVVNNGTIVSGQGTNSIIFSATSSTAPSVYVVLTDSNNCGAQTPTTNVPFRTVAGPTVHTDGNALCPNGTPGMAWVDSNYATYSWTISNGVFTGPTNGPNVSFQAINQYPLYVTATVTDSGGCTSSTTQQVMTRTIGSAPSVYITPTSLCPNGAPGTATVTDASRFTTFQWSITNGTFTGPTNGSTVSYIATSSSTVNLLLTVYDSGGCTTSVGIPIPIRTLPVPTVNVTPVDVCPNGAPGSATVSNTSDYTTYAWTITNGAFDGPTNGSTVNFHATSTSPVGLNVVGSDAGGCSASKSVSVPIRTIPAPQITVDTPDVCPGGYDAATTGTGYGNYAWTITNGVIDSGNGTNRIYFHPTSMSAPVSLGLAVTDVSGCSALSTSVDVPLREIPAPQITVDTLDVCPGGYDAATTGSNYGNYVWTITNGAIDSGNGTNRVYFHPTSMTAPVSLGVTVTDINGCSAVSSSVDVPLRTIPAPQITVDTLDVCPGGYDAATTGSNYGNYAWTITNGVIDSGNGTNRIYFRPTSATLPVTLGLTVTDINGCSAVSSSVDVPLRTIPAPEITLDQLSICSNASDAATVSSNYSSYDWTITNGVIDSGNNTNRIYFHPTGLGNVTVALTVTDINGCSAVSTTVDVPVTFIATPAITASGPTTFCAGGSVALTAPAGYTYSWSNGATTQSIVVSTSGSYTVTVGDANGCSATSDATTVTVNPLPNTTITASGPTTFCVGGSVTLTAPAGYTYSWSNGATTQSIVVNASGNYSVTINDATGCSATSAPTTVTVNPLPTATITASGPTTFCEGNSVTLTAPAGYTYSWSNGATSQSIVVNVSGNFSVLVIDANGCSARSATTTVTVYAQPDPMITASGPTTFCAGGSVTLTASASQSYLWSNGATSQSITVTTSGSYSVTETNAICSATSQPVVVTVDPPLAKPNVSSTATSICPGGSVTMTASESGGSGVYMYQWYDIGGAIPGANANVYTASPSSNRYYYVDVTDSIGCRSTTSDAVIVTVNASPDATITASSAMCAGSTSSASVSDAGPGATYNWTISGGTIQYIMSNGTAPFFTANSGSTAVTLGVTVTTAAGCSSTSAQKTVAVNPLPQVVFSTTPNAACLNQEGAQEVVPQSGVTYAWSIVNGTITQDAGHRVYYIPTANPVTLTVTLTDANGCSASDSVTIPVESVSTPSISASGPTTFCAGGGVTLTAPAGFTYSWSNGATSQAITVNTSGNYSVTVTNANGCSATSAATTVTVNANPSTPAITPNGPTTFCNGGSVTLAAPAGFTYSWSNGATSQSINVSTSGNYSVTVTNANGCSATSAPTSVTVNATPSTPTITANGPTTFCAGGNVTLTAPAGFTYLWSNGATTPSISVNTSGNYSVTVTNANGCSATSAPTTVTVNANPSTPTITANGPTTFCNGGSVTLTAPAGFTYLWSNGASSQSINVNTSGNYSVTVTNANGCSATSAPTTVTVNANPSTPVITPNGPTTFCNGGSVTLTAPAGFTYSWSNGATSQAIIVNTSGSYSVTVTNANGCSATSAPTTVTVNANPSTPTITPNGPTTFCAGGNVTLSAPAGFTYLWSNGATTQAIVVSASGNYSVTVTNANGCSATSAPTAVTVNAATQITSQPSPATQTVLHGVSATITVTATGSGTLSYQWYQGAAGNTTKPVGTNSNVLQITQAKRGTYTYWVRVTGSCGVVNSNLATVNVN